MHLEPTTAPVHLLIRITALDVALAIPFSFGAWALPTTARLGRFSRPNHASCPASKLFARHVWSEENTAVFRTDHTGLAKSLEAVHEA